jgi:hypothetical protein
LPDLVNIAEIGSQFARSAFSGRPFVLNHETHGPDLRCGRLILLPGSTPHVASLHVTSSLRLSQLSMREQFRHERAVRYANCVPRATGNPECIAALETRRPLNQDRLAIDHADRCAFSMGFPRS